ncbi:unnamed protein product [Symbiodinium natans]|uniref:Uncharacterized protein n=1 Tax=Symbiodinium natans TaxID=878477 RepID=A0A812NAH7_9DINO|nr:unnamed protein product [Symbiodinium natans]
MKEEYYRMTLAELRDERAFVERRMEMIMVKHSFIKSLIEDDDISDDDAEDAEGKTMSIQIRYRDALSFCINLQLVSPGKTSCTSTWSLVDANSEKSDFALVEGRLPTSKSVCADDTRSKVILQRPSTTGLY